MGSTLYMIKNVGEQERDALLAELVQFAFDSDSIRAAHFNGHVLVDVEGGLGNITAFSRKIKKGIKLASEDFINIPLDVIYNCGGEED